MAMEKIRENMLEHVKPINAINTKIEYCPDMKNNTIMAAIATRMFTRKYLLPESSHESPDRAEGKINTRSDTRSRNIKPTTLDQ